MLTAIIIAFVMARSVSSTGPVERNAVASFSAPEELRHIHVDRHSQQPDVPIENYLHVVE